MTKGGKRDLAWLLHHLPDPNKPKKTPRKDELKAAFNTVRYSTRQLLLPDNSHPVTQAFLKKWHEAALARIEREIEARNKRTEPFQEAGAEARHTRSKADKITALWCASSRA
jgi:hypothetical protein